MARNIRTITIALLLVASWTFSVSADQRFDIRSRLKLELLRQNREAGSPLTRQQIGDFCQAMTKPAAEIRQTPSIDVGFHDAPGPATDGSIPLGDRIPLILVHGSSSDVISDGEFGRPLNDMERWISYLEAFNADSDFSSSFKVYRFVYDSRLGIEQNGASLVSVIDNISSYSGWENEDLDGKDFLVLAHSMGGLVARAAMNTQFTQGIDAGDYFGDHVINLVALGAPHRGSPWAIPAWVYDSVLRGSGMTELDFYFAYVLHWGFEPYEGEFDLAWDNYDDGLPLTDMITHRELFIPTMKDVGGGPDQHRESLVNPYPGDLNSIDMFTGNLILYCAENPPASHVNTIFDLSFYYALGILNEHHLLGFTSNKLATIIAGDLGEGGLKPYGNNDGLVPAASAVFDGEMVSEVIYLDNSDHLSLLDNSLAVDAVVNKLLDIATGQ